jgi:hypothetical protein
MNYLRLFMLVLAFHFFFGCAPKYVYVIQLYETLEDTEFEAMYGSDGHRDFPETGIVVENNSHEDIAVMFEGNSIKTVSVLSRETWRSNLPSGTYNYTISAQDPAETRPWPTRLLRVFNRETPIKSLTGEKTVREKCRTTFHVFLEKKAVK